MRQQIPILTTLARVTFVPGLAHSLTQQRCAEGLVCTWPSAGRWNYGGWPEDVATPLRNTRKTDSIPLNLNSACDISGHPHEEIPDWMQVSFPKNPQSV